MSQHGRHRNNPLAARNRDQHDHLLPLHFQQAFVDFLSRIGHGTPVRYDEAPYYEYHDGRGYEQPNRRYGAREYGPEPQALRTAAGSQVPRPRATQVGDGEGKAGEPLGKSMKKLHKALTSAEELYGKFLSDYDNDVVNIKKYAQPESRIDTLWTDKIAAKKPDDPNEDLVEEGEKFERKHEDEAKKLKKALYEATYSTLGSSAQNNKFKLRQANAERLRIKVEIASGQITDLLEHVLKDRESCDSLVAEVQLLKALVDPMEGTGRNKKLYKSGDDDESEAEGDGNQQSNDRDY